MITNPLERIRSAWQELYTGSENLAKLEVLLEELEIARKDSPFDAQPEGWYKDAVIYSLYVDFFAGTFDGLTEKLDHLKSLGVNCLWLLPILDSPMRDAGFDIRDYRNIRAELFGFDPNTEATVKQQAFREFLAEAHSRGIRVIFDIAMNHTSEEHPWYVS